MKPTASQSSLAGAESAATAFLRAVGELWRCAFPVVIAGVLGAMVDEWHHLGVSSWISLCLARPLPLATALSFQAQLLICSYVAMSGVAVFQWLVAVQGKRRHPAGSLLLGQGCCALAMLLALLICPKVLAAGSSGPADLLAMVSTDMLCAAAGVVLGATLRAAWRSGFTGLRLRTVA